MRKTFTLIAALVLALACKVEKTSDDTYSVTAPTPEAEAAAQKAKEEAKEAGQVIREKTAEGAQIAGDALKKAGEEMKSDTTATTSTTVTSGTSGTTATTTTRTTTY